MKRMRLTGPERSAADWSANLPSPLPSTPPSPPQSMQPAALPLPSQAPAAIRLETAARPADGGRDWWQLAQPLARVARFLPLRDGVRLAATSATLRGIVRPHIGIERTRAQQVGSLWRLREVLGSLARMPVDDQGRLDVLLALLERLRWLPWKEALAGWQAVLKAGGEGLATAHARASLCAGLAQHVRRTLAQWAIGEPYRRLCPLPFLPFDRPDCPDAGTVLAACAHGLDALREFASALHDPRRQTHAMLTVHGALAFLHAKAALPWDHQRWPFDVAVWLERIATLNRSDRRAALDAAAGCALIMVPAQARAARAEAVCRAVLAEAARWAPADRVMAWQALATVNPLIDAPPIGLVAGPDRIWRAVMADAASLPGTEIVALASAVLDDAGPAEVLGPEALAQDIWELAGLPQLASSQRAALWAAAAPLLPRERLWQARETLLDDCIRHGLDAARREPLYRLTEQMSAGWTGDPQWLPSQLEVQRRADLLAPHAPELAAVLYRPLIDQFPRIHGAMILLPGNPVSLTSSAWAERLLNGILLLPAQSLRDDLSGRLLPFVERKRSQALLASRFDALGPRMRLHWLIRASAGHRWVDLTAVTGMLEALAALEHDDMERRKRAASMTEVAETLVAHASGAKAAARCLAGLLDRIADLDLGSEPALAQALAALAIVALHRAVASRPNGDPPADALSEAELRQLVVDVDRAFARLAAIPAEQRQAALRLLATRNAEHGWNVERTAFGTRHMLRLIRSLPPMLRVPLLLDRLHASVGGRNLWRDEMMQWCEAVDEIPLEDRSALLFATAPLFCEEPIFLTRGDGGMADLKAQWRVMRAQWQQAMVSLAALDPAP